jgi:hypothetical protein
MALAERRSSQTGCSDLKAESHGHYRKEEVGREE